MAVQGPPASGPIRVAVVTDPPGGSTDAAVRAAVLRAADALSDAGYEVVEACPPTYAQATEVWGRLLMGDLALGLPMMTPMMGADAVTFLEWTNTRIAPLRDVLDLSRLMIARDAIAQDWSRFMAEHPLILSPTWTTLPFTHGQDVAGPDEAVATINLIRPVVPADLLGLPSACVPAGLDPASGLPVGVLLTGRRMRDDQCLDAAEAVEARLSVETPIDPRW